jgi:3-dehydroquinate synthase
MIRNVRVALGERGYDIKIGPGLLERAGEFVGAVRKVARIFVVTDANVAATHLPRLEKGLRASGIEPVPILRPAGEGAKTWDGLGELLNAVLDARPERGDMLLALGGGVIGDMTGVAASLLLRGLDFVQCPTTLLAQVDSSVGGKTGVNTRHGKNLIGAFHQPRLVLCDLEALDTLPARELRAGYAETVKYGLIDRPDFFAWCEANAGKLLAGDREARAYAVEVSCQAKARIVAEDERETGARALLNLGHTFGHALEAELGFGPELLHGEAVALGMRQAFDFSARAGLCPAPDAARVAAHLASCGLPVALPKSRRWSAERLIAHMGHDKKTRGGKVMFVLARGIGKSFVARDADIGAVRAMLEAECAA